VTLTSASSLSSGPPPVTPAALPSPPPGGPPAARRRGLAAAAPGLGRGPGRAQPGRASTPGRSPAAPQRGAAPTELHEIYRLACGLPADPATGAPAVPQQCSEHDTVSWEGCTPCSAQADLDLCASSECFTNPGAPGCPVCCLCRLGSGRCTDPAYQALCSDRLLCHEPWAAGCPLCCVGSMPVPSLREAAERSYASMDPGVGVSKREHFLLSGRQFGVSTETDPLP